MTFKDNVIKYLIRFAWLIGIGTIVGFAIYGYSTGIFYSSESFATFVRNYSTFAPVILFVINIVNITIPILPGAHVASVIIYGMWVGFLLNYVSIVIGSIIAFQLSRHYGRNFVRHIISEKTYEKYMLKMEDGGKFEKFFTIMMFMPIGPDDLLCLLAGLTHMRFKKFVIVILLSKPLSIFIFTTGLAAVIQRFF